MNKGIILFLIVILIIIGGTSIYYLKGIERTSRLSPIVKLFKEINPAPAVNNNETNLPGDLSSYYSIESLKASDKTIASIGLTFDNYPIIDGATASQPIRALIACETFNIRCDWYENEAREMFLSPGFYSLSSSLGLSYEEIDSLKKKIDVNSKTHDAYMKLIQGSIDLILVSTKPSREELEEAKKLGVKLELVPIGLDGFIFLVNKENPINNLSSADIVGIYSGGIKSWRNIPGADSSMRSKLTRKFSSITAYTRPVNSGSQELMEKLVMKGVPMDANLKEERIIMSMAPLIEGVEEKEDSIGYSLYYYKNNMIDKRNKNPNVKLISVNGIEPNPKNIASKKYPYIFNIYAATRSDQPESSIPYKIKEWLTSEEGQAVISEAGYIGLGD